jgi:hypothetical protein
MWIFKSGLQDFLKIYLPSIVGLFIVFLSEKENTNAFFYFFIFHLVDVGHVYSTMLRTIFNKEELKREYKTLLAPLMIAIISFLWLFLKIPFFWSFVVYFTVFHNLRQGWGFVRWYEKLNNKYHNNELLYYCFTIIPFFIFHLRDVGTSLIYYSQTDYINFDFLKFNTELNFLSYVIPVNNTVFVLAYILYGSCLLIWIAKEVSFACKNKKIEFNRIGAMLYFIFVYAYAFLYATSSMQIFTLIILSHGIPYVFVMSKFLNKKEVKRYKIMLFILVFLGAALNLVLEDFYLEPIFNYTVVDIDFLEYLFTLIYITPILSHFVWDMYLWKKEHPDSKLIY